MSAWVVTVALLEPTLLAIAALVMWRGAVNTERRLRRLERVERMRRKVARARRPRPLTPAEAEQVQRLMRLFMEDVRRHVRTVPDPRPTAAAERVPEPAEAETMPET